MHAGPGETHPGGVAPGESQRFAVPTGEVVPGLKILLERDDEPVMLSVTSVIRTIQGEEHGTRGFHEPDPTGNCGVGLTDQLFVADIIDEREIAANRTMANLTT